MVKKKSANTPVGPRSAQAKAPKKAVKKDPYIPYDPETQAPPISVPAMDEAPAGAEGIDPSPALVVCKPGRPALLAEAELINIICGAVADGATDVAVCNALGIAASTFGEWKAKGRAGIEPYRTFYIRYKQADGKREIEWSRLACRDPKWALTHHPNYKMRWAEPRVYKEGGKKMFEQMEAKKAGIAREMEKYGFDDEDDDEDGAEERDSEEEGYYQEEMEEAPKDTDGYCAREPVHPDNTIPETG